jgi:hypothetical protein
MKMKKSIVLFLIAFGFNSLLAQSTNPDNPAIAPTSGVQTTMPGIPQTTGPDFQPATPYTQPVSQPVATPTDVQSVPGVPPVVPIQPAITTPASPGTNNSSNTNPVNTLNPGSPSSPNPAYPNSPQLLKNN